MNPADTARPVFRFEGVTARVFPLRADPRALQRLCDDYLNLCPEAIAFRPAAPYVLFADVHYDRMTSSFEDGLHEGGVSQNEAYFGVPLLSGHMERGHFRRSGSAMVTPYIFLDQAGSIELGRELYGFPKQAAEFRREDHGPWPSDARGGREHVLTVAAETFRTPFAGQSPSNVPLVSVDRKKPSSLGLDGWQAMVGLGASASGGVAMWREAMRLWSSATVADAQSYVGALLGQAGPWPIWQGSFFYTANLKQVRSIEDPTIASYQAITMAPMRVIRMRRGGPLGATRVALGDPTGGYRLTVHRHPFFPIIERLGLVVSHAPPSETEVATLDPLFPFWTEVDLDYGAGASALCRGPHMRGGAWRWHVAAEAAPEVDAVAQTGVPRSAEGHAEALPRFDPTWGAEAVPAPPFHYPELSLRVLALPATQALNQVVAEWQPPPMVGTFRLLEPDRPQALMVVLTSGKMTAHVNDVGAWWQRRVSFFVPVIWTRHGEERAALVAMISFAHGTLAATIAREVGLEVIAAAIHAPADSWRDDAGSSGDRRLLWLAQDPLPATATSAPLREDALLEVMALDPRAPGRGAIPTSSLPAGELRLCVVSRRRLRDPVDPAELVYDEWFSQNLVARKIESDSRRRSTGPLEVRFHPQAGRLDLARRLALAGAEVTPIGDASGTLALTHEGNTCLAVRTCGEGWSAPSRPPGITPCEPWVDEASQAWLAAFCKGPESLGHG